MTCDFKPCDINKFKKLVKSYDCRIEFITDHRNLIFDKKDNLLMSFAINHHKNTKKFVLPSYVKHFLELVN